MTSPLNTFLAASPFIAILRGITPDDVVPVTEALHAEGWRIVEVPLNSPDAFASIARLRARFADDMLIGAGTVRREHEVLKLRDLGAQLMVSPHVDASLVRTAKSAHMVALPGVATASECFQALDAGADGLKLFPADALGTATLRALRSVLPAGSVMLPVGGIAPEHLAQWRSAGANGFGIGGALYRPGHTPAQVQDTARRFNAAWTETAGAS